MTCVSASCPNSKVAGVCHSNMTLDGIIIQSEFQGDCNQNDFDTHPS